MAHQPDKQKRVGHKPGAYAEKHSPSMHEGVEPWCDACSCEAEPRWQALAEEMALHRGEDRPECEPAGPDADLPDWQNRE